MNYDHIIFLDFDGVLATDDYDDILMERNDSLRDFFGRKFDPNCVASLKMIIESTNADIVITSSWRHYLNPFSMRFMWRLRKMPGRVIGLTPSMSDNRSLEIESWLSKHPEIVNYVILDDMDKRQFESRQHTHLVTCNHLSGLSMQDAQKALLILKGITSLS